MDNSAVVDFQRLLNSPNEKDWKGVAEDVRRACHENGFMYIVNHGIPAEVIEQAFKESISFFQLPDSVKAQVSIDPKDDYRGHNAQGKETLSKDSPYEIKESFAVVGDVSSQKFPDSHLPSFKKAVEELQRNCYPVTNNLLKLFGLILNPADESYLLERHRHFTDHTTPNISILRTHFYPPVPPDGNTPDNSVRCASHCDYGTFTLLFQDSMGGLEARSKTGDWIPADPIPGGILVLVGDLLHQWSKGYFQATEHRVLVPEDEILRRSTRQSMAYFVFPDDETMIYPRESTIPHVGVAGPLSTREYYLRRVQAIQYGYRDIRTNCELVLL